MGNRSKFLALSAAAAAVATARRRHRLRLAAEGIGTNILPSAPSPGAREGDPSVDEGHAPGHRHLPADRATWRRLRRRPPVESSPKERYPYARS